MKSTLISRFALGAYLLVFFGYLLGPLLVMSLTAFNTASFPTISPWACYSYEWFDVLFKDERILNGIKNSIIIGTGTVILSVSIGLAAALVLTQIWPRFRSAFYTIIIAPILIPGVVLGISTLVFWDRVSRVFGPSTDLLFHNGIFLTVLGQSTFIASYAMLVFVARLQRFDPGLTEAALDLGASHSQAFRKILLPFMRPAIASAAVLAFLASFENYNTTTFTFGNYPTLTIELAQKVRYGINPSISALAFIIVMVTIFAALANEAFRRNRVRKEDAKAKGVTLTRGRFLPSFMTGNPAALIFVLLSFIAIVLVSTAQSYSPNECKARVLSEKQALTAQRIEALRQQRALQQQSAPATTTTAPAPSTSGSSNGAFGNVFAPTNLNEAAPVEAPAADSGAANGAFGNVFAPTNLGTTTGN